MRLWHIDLIEFLPRSQLIAQWRELNSIFKKQDVHILINYIYSYSKKYLFYYTQKVVDEMRKRCYNIYSWDNYNTYFADLEPTTERLVFREHDDEYLKICYYNLREKYLRGQQDFTDDQWRMLNGFTMQKEILNGTTI